MPRIAGVKFEKDARGNNRYVRIDLKQHAIAMAPVLKQLGAVKLSEEEAYRQKVHREHAQGVPIDEAFDQVKDFLRTLPWKKKK